MTALVRSIVLVLGLGAVAAMAEEAAKPQAVRVVGEAAPAGQADKPSDVVEPAAAPRAPAGEAAAPAPADLAKFCADIVDPAREQRYQRKEQELKALLGQVEERMKALEAKRAEYEDWVKRREEFAKRASGNLVEIYGKMKPEAAAARMAILEPDLSASILLALTPAKASVILNEMEEKKAATLTDIMAASARKKDPS